MKIQIMTRVAGLFVIATILHGLPAVAADTVYLVQIQDVLVSRDARNTLDGSVSFYFGDATHPKIDRNFGNYITNKKTNGFGKSAETACNWVFLSALLQLQQRAKQQGGNAVVNIHSYYKKREVSSTKEVECHKGFTIAGVALKGDVVKLAGR